MIRNFGLILKAFVLTSCSYLTSIPSNLLSTDESIKITIDLQADNMINPDYDNRAQPVKSCVYLVKSRNWVPESVYEGTPCEAIGSNSQDVIEYKELMVMPSKAYQIEFDIVYNRKDKSPLWVVVGANFQQINDFQPTDKVEILKKKKKIVVPVKINRNSIMVQKKGGDSGPLVF